VAVAFHLPDGPTVEVHGSVVNVSGGGFFVQFDKGIEYEALQSAVEFVTELSSASLEIPKFPAENVEDSIVPPRPEEPAEAIATPAPIAVPAPEPEPEKKPAIATPIAGAARPAWELLDMGSDVPLHKQLAELTSAEKVKLARHANKPVRQLLVRDTDKRVHLEVVKNPKVSAAEIMEFTSNAQLGAEALRWISAQRRHMRTPAVVFNLVVNPATPGDVAQRLVAGLPQNELLKVSRNKRAKEAVQRQAKKRLMELGII